ncbi:MAG: hypothetical protein U5L11_09390 [Arhodomonas sp.]|nr:hypothetical protein [Arhodomonas sp.]
MIANHRDLPSAEITLGQGITDWNGIAPIVVDPEGDSSTDYDSEDMVAGFIARDSENLYFRVDVVDTANIQQEEEPADA